MKKSTLISIIALLVSIIGVLIALVAYFKRRRCLLCDDMGDEMFDDDYLDYDEEELDDGCENSQPEDAPGAVQEDAGQDEISF